MATTPSSRRHKKSSSTKRRPSSTKSKSGSAKHRKVKRKSSTHAKSTKAKRAPSAYNLFMKDELKRLKAKHGFVKGAANRTSFKEIFSEAASNWK